MPRKSLLTVKPLNAWNLSKFSPHSIQTDEKKETQKIFRHGFPAHQAMFYDGRKSILACGLIDIGDSQYYLWTLFGCRMSYKHVIYIFNYLNKYLRLLNYKSIHHIIRRDYPNSRRMMKLLGFQFVRYEGDNLEHWIKM